MASRRTIAHRLTTPSHKSPVPTPEPSWFRGRKLALLSFVFPKPGAVLWGDGGPTLDGVPIPEDIREEENRFKFALLSTTLLLFIAYDLLLLLFLCPLLESNSSSTGFMPATSPPRSPAQVSAAFFRSCIEAFLLLNSALLVFLYLVRHIAAAACCVFLYINGGVWTVCIVCGPVSEFLACLVHVPMLAFYVFGHNAGVRALAVTLGQITVYSVALLLGFVPTSGYTLELGPTAQMLAVMGSFVLLGLSACVNERARMQALCKYQQANKRLSKTTRAKARFLANVSHELRTPLHGIVAAGEELVEQLVEDDVPPLPRDMASIVVECSRHMLSLINDVLDFERMETKQMKVERIPFDIADELQKLAKMLAPMAKQKNILVKQEIFVETQRRMGDPLRFRQMVFNLASNALKFTPEGGTVTIRVAHARQEQEDIGNKRRRKEKPKQQHKPEQKQKQKQSEEVGAVDIKQKTEREAVRCCTEHGCCNPEDMVRVEVQDTGIGIPDDHLPLIFKSFTQADASTTRKFGGSGLGLAICKRLCRLMEGEIGVESKRGEGSTFWFHLPLPPATAEHASMMSPVVTKQMTESGQGKSRNGETLQGVKALLVEDNVVNQKIGVQMLVRAGCSVSVAENGEQCLRAMDEKGPFDVVLMDCHMPIMDGLETTRRIRQREQERHEARTPVIALTASTSPEEMHQCTLAGMDDWLGKPFDRAILTHVIRRWVRPPAPPNADRTSPAMSAARSV